MGFLDRVLNKPIPRKQFAKLMSSALREAGVDILSINEEDSSLTRRDWGTIYLDNVYALHSKANRNERQAVIDNFVRSVAEWESNPTPASFEVAAPRLMPVLRSRVYHSAIQLTQRAKGEPSVGLKLKPFVGGLVANLAYDTDRSITHIGESEFDKWNVDFDAAFATATSNLRNFADLDGFVEMSPGLYKGAWDDSYDSSRMLIPDIIQRLPLFGDPVAFVPGRNHLWVTGSNDQAAIAKMLEVGGEALFEPYELSDNLFLFDGAQWWVYKSDTPSIASALRELQHRRAVMDYQQQKADLERIYEREQTDVFVASHAQWESPDGASYTCCVWSKDIPSLLPKTEMIIFLIDADGDKKDVFVVSWDLVESHFPELLPQAKHLFPARQEAYTFPTPEQIMILRGLSVSRQQ
jgi:hypothetical protein